MDILCPVHGDTSPSGSQNARKLRSKCGRAYYREDLFLMYFVCLDLATVMSIMTHIAAIANARRKTSMITGYSME